MRLMRANRGFNSIMLGIGIVGLGGAFPLAAVAQQIPVYRGAVQYPDFTGRDKDYSTFRTRIRNEMMTGPNFAGRYAIIQLGCGTGCRFVFAADLSTGKVYDFPYGGEEYSMLDLRFNVKSNLVTAKWIANGRCLSDDLVWNGYRFSSENRRVLGDSSRCSE